MAGDEDWLALQIANAQSPFRTFQKPDAPFEASGPGPDTVYTTEDVNRIQGHRGRSNPLRSAFRWVADKIKGYQEAPGGNADEHKLAGSLRLSDIPLMIAESGERYAGGFGHAMHGENRPGMGFAGTGVDEPALLVPPQAAAAFIPGLRGAIVRGEASPISTYDKVRAKLEESPLFNWERPGVLGDRGLPLPGAPTLPSIWPGPEFLPETGPAWKHQANPLSEEAGRIRGHLKSLTGEETWPKAPPFEDTSPLGPNGSKSMNAEMGRPGNERDVGEVKLNAESDAKLAPFARRTEPLPVTDAVKQWLEMATGKEPRVQVATGPNQTDYVKVPVEPGFHRNGIKVPFVRVAEDAHPGRPRPGQIDTAPAEHPKFTDESNRRNAAGDPFGTNYQALVNSLKWATSSTPLRKGIPPGQWAGPEGNWLVEGAEPHAAGGKPYGEMPQWARYAKEEAAPKPVEGADFSPEQLKLLAKGGDLKTMLAAARGDPDKLASIRKTIESLRGVSPGGIAKVLETQHGLDIHPGDVPEFTRGAMSKVPAMPNQSQPSLQSRIDKAYEHTRPGPRSIRSEPGFPQRFWEAWDRHQGHQQKVADELGVSQSTVYGWKNQIPRPSPQTAEGAAAEAARFSAQRGEVGKRTLDAGNRYRGGRSFMNEGKRELTPQEPLLGKKAPSRGPGRYGYEWKDGKRVLPSADKLTQRNTWRAEQSATEAARQEAANQASRSADELTRRGGKPFWDETGRAAAAESDMKAVRELFGKKPDDTTLFSKAKDPIYHALWKGDKTGFDYAAGDTFWGQDTLKRALFKHHHDVEAEGKMAGVPEVARRMREQFKDHPQHGRESSFTHSSVGYALKLHGLGDLPQRQTGGLRDVKAEAARRVAEEGATITQAAKDAGINRTTLQRHIEATGKPSSSYQLRGPSPEVQKALEAIRNGMSMAEASKKFGFQYGTLTYHLEKAGEKFTKPKLKPRSALDDLEAPRRDD